MAALTTTIAPETSITLRRNIAAGKVPSLATVIAVVTVRLNRLLGVRRANVNADITRQVAIGFTHRFASHHRFLILGNVSVSVPQCALHGWFRIPRHVSAFVGPQQRNVAPNVWISATIGGIAACAEGTALQTNHAVGGLASI